MEDELEDGVDSSEEEEDLQDEPDETDNEDQGEEDNADDTPPAQDEEEEEPAAPPAVVISNEEDADDEVLRNLLGDEAYAAISRKFERRMQQQLQAVGAANLHVTRAATENPELFRVHGARIQHALTQLAPELRAKPEAVNIAVATVFMEEANKHGISKAIQKMASQSSQGKAAPPKPTTKAPIPASQRPPSSGQGRSAPQQTVGRREAQVRELVAEGYSRDEAASILMTGGK